MPLLGIWSICLLFDCDRPSTLSLCTLCIVYRMERRRRCRQEWAQIAISLYLFICFALHCRLDVVASKSNAKAMRACILFPNACNVTCVIISRRFFFLSVFCCRCFLCTRRGLLHEILGFFYFALAKVFNHSYLPQYNKRSVLNER